MKLNIVVTLAPMLTALLLSSVVIAQSLVDPTRPVNNNSSASAKAEQVDTLVLNAIFINGVNRHAIINGVTVKEGQDVAGKTLISISKNRVVLRGVKGPQELFVNHSQFIKDAHDGF